MLVRTFVVEGAPTQNQWSLEGNRWQSWTTFSNWKKYAYYYNGRSMECWESIPDDKVLAATVLPYKNGVNRVGERVWILLSHPHQLRFLGLILIPLQIVILMLTPCHSPLKLVWLGGKRKADIKMDIGPKVEVVGRVCL